VISALGEGPQGKTPPNPLLFTPRFSEVIVGAKINPSRFNGFEPGNRLKRLGGIESCHSTSLKRGVNERSVESLTTQVRHYPQDSIDTALHLIAELCPPALFS